MFDNINFKILQAPNPQKEQTHSKSLFATAEELFKCVRPFCGVDAESVKR